MRIAGLYDGYEELEWVGCETCGGDNMHIELAEVNCMGDIHTIANDGYSHRKGDPAGRGSVVAIHLFCESGHAQIVRFKFHKGLTILEATKKPDREWSANTPELPRS